MENESKEKAENRAADAGNFGNSGDLKTSGQESESNRGGTTNLSLDQLKEEGNAGGDYDQDEDNQQENGTGERQA